MKLLLDIGNTRVTWTLAHGQTLEPPRRCAHDDCAEAWAALDISNTVVYACSVASPALTQSVTDALGALPVTWAATGATFDGLVNGYHRPAEMGVDRWLALIGARWRFPRRALVVVDAGTAVTLDAVSSNGEHLGGAILAGYRTQRAALASVAPALAIADGAAQLPARNTAGALTAGTLYGLAGAIDRVAGELQPNDNGPVRILTGGDAERLAPLLSADWVVDPLVTLRGLWCFGESACAGLP